MSNEIIGLVCLAVCVIWVVFGLFIGKDFNAPKNKKQFFALLILAGPFGIIVELVILVGVLIEYFYKKLGE